MATILFSYPLDAALQAPSIHGRRLVSELHARGHRLLTLERVDDPRLERFPRTPAGARAALARADALYFRARVRRFELGLFEWNRRVTRRPVVVEINGPPEETLAYRGGPEARARVWMRRRVYQHLVGASNATRCVSRVLAEDIRASFLRTPPLLEVVPNGGVPAPEPARSRQGFHAVWAGASHRPWQAPDLVAAAARRLAEAVPGALVHVFDGAPPSASRFRPGPGLRLHGRVAPDALARTLGEMDAALCLYRTPPRVSQGFYQSPLKLFEAFGFGLPVVASGIGQIAEVVEPGRTGLLVGDDGEEAGRALVTLARDVAARRAMGRAALAACRERYSWAHVGAGVDALLGAVLEPRGAVLAA